LSRVHRSSQLRRFVTRYGTLFAAAVAAAAATVASYDEELELDAMKVQEIGDIW
jgi:hypothetical protein